MWKSSKNKNYLCSFWHLGLIYHGLWHSTMTKFYSENHQNIELLQTAAQLIKKKKKDNLRSLSGTRALFSLSLCLFMCQGLAFTYSVSLIQASCNIKMFMQPFPCLKQQQMFLACKDWGKECSYTLSRESLTMEWFLSCPPWLIRAINEISFPLVTHHLLGNPKHWLSTEERASSGFFAVRNR